MLVPSASLFAYLHLPGYYLLIAQCSWEQKLWSQTPVIQPCPSWLISLSLECQWGKDPSLVSCLKIVRNYIKLYKTIHILYNYIKLYVYIYTHTHYIKLCITWGHGGSHDYSQVLGTLSLLCYSLWNGLLSPFYRCERWRISICFIQYLSQTMLLLVYEDGLCYLCLFPACLLYLK